MARHVDFGMMAEGKELAERKELAKLLLGLWHLVPLMKIC